MLTYDLSQRGEESRYIYLYQRIKADIEAGSIAAGERLPSKRGLAQHLGVSLVTVENAYAQLVAEGYVRSEPRRGYYAQAVTGQQAFGGASGKAPRAAASPSHRLAPQVLSVPEGDPLIADLTGRTPARELFPYNLWARALRQALACESEESLVDESRALGSARLRRALAAYLRGSRGMRVEPDQIVVGAGAQMLYGLIVQLLGRDKKFALEDPGYPRLTNIYDSLDVESAHVALDEGGIQMQALRASGADVAHIMPSHQYPTGLITPISRRYELLGWASERQDRYLIEDDYDCEFRLSGRPIPPLQSIDMQGRVIYVNTFTRTLGSAFRLGYMVLPPDLAQEYKSRLGFYACTVSVIDQLALARLIESGEYERHLNRCRSHYRKVRDLLVDALKASALAPHVGFSHADGGLHFVLTVESLLTEEELASAARDQGVALSPLSFFLMDVRNVRASDKRQMVINFNSLDASAVPAVVEALERAWMR